MIAGCNVILDTWHVSVTRDTNMLSSDWSVVTLLWSLIGRYTGAWRSHVRKKISLNDSVSRNPKLGQAVARYGDIYTLFLFFVISYYI